MKVSKSDLALGLATGLLLFSYTFAVSIAKGGRWDLYQPLYMGNHGIEYWSVVSGELTPSTPYFPLVAFVLFVLERVGLGGEISALVLAALLTAMLPWVVALFTRRFFMNLNTARAGTFLAVFSLIFLNPWIGYAGEFKPDTLALILLVSGVLVLERTKKSSLILGPSLITMALLTKQQIWALGLVFGIFLVFRYLQGPNKDSLTKLIATAATPLVALLILYLVPGAIDFAVIGHQGRGFEFLFGWGYVRPLLGIGIIAAGLVALWFHRPEINSPTERTDRIFFIAFGLMWFTAGVFGALNDGGNNGNLAVGAIFLPLLLWPLLTRRSKITLIGPIIASGFVAVALISSLSIAPIRLSDVEIIQEDISRLNPASVLLDSDSLIFVLDLEAEVIDLGSWLHVRSGDLASEVPESAIEIVQDSKPALIVCSNRCSWYFSSGELLDLGYVEVKIQGLRHFENLEAFSRQ